MLGRPSVYLAACISISISIKRCSRVVACSHPTRVIHLRPTQFPENVLHTKPAPVCAGQGQSGSNMQQQSLLQRTRNRRDMQYSRKQELVSPLAAAGKAACAAAAALDSQPTAASATWDSCCAPS